MDNLLQLRLLLFGAEALPVGSDQQQAKALQLKCLLGSLGIQPSDRTHAAAEAMLDAGAQSRRDRLWSSVTHASGLDKDFTLLEGSLAQLDLSSSLLKGLSMSNLTDIATSAREASSKAHTAVMEHHQRLQQVTLLHTTTSGGQRQLPPTAAAGAPETVVAGGVLAPQATFVTASSLPNGAASGSTALQRPGMQAQVGPARPPFRMPMQPPACGNPQGPPQTGAAAGPHHPQGGPMQPPESSRWQTAGPANGPMGPGGGQGNGGVGSGGSTARWAAGKRPAPPDMGGPNGDDEGGGGGGLGPGGGFRTAKAQLVADSIRKGQAPPTFANQAPRTGLMRPQKKQQTGGAGGGGGQGGRGFVPPFVAKGIEGPPGAGGGGMSGEGGDVESPYPPRLLEMLSERNLLTYGPEGNVVVPEPLAKLDPKIIDNVFNEVLDRSASIGWGDIAGQDAAKRLVQEMVVWPMLNPQLFRGARAPPRGLLLFGPPGTGKTLIGKAVAANISATFFSISASSLTSKWIGEGEKMVRALFALAGCLQPSVIFIDEIDSLLSARKAEGEHEASRRLKTEMLVQMDGCDPGSGERRVLVIGATNRPEELDEAARRRMPKQLYIPLPCGAARHQMLLNALRAGSEVTHALSAPDLSKIVERTAGYSGSDMKNLIQEACQGPVRDLFRSRGNVTNVTANDLRPVNIRDFQMASKAQKRTVSDVEVERYEKYDSQFGAKYVDEQGGGGAGVGSHAEVDAGEGGDGEEVW